MGMTPPVVPIEQRFLEKVVKDKKTGCWLWTGSVRPSGYSQFRYSKQKNGYGHRFAYENFVGPVPEGRQLHHTCGVRHCVNPEHLVPTAPKVHKGHHAPTHCKRGHPLSGDNLYSSPSGRRVCRTCNAANRDKWLRENPHKQSEYASAYQKRHREKVNAYQREYKKKLREDARRWRESHPD